LFAAVAALLFTLSPRPAEAGTAPVLHAPAYAAVVGGDLRMEGSGLGEANTPRAIVFASAGTTTTIEAGDASILSWSASEIRVTVPPSVRAGLVTVVVDGVESSPAQLEVFELVTYDIPAGLTPTGSPLAVDVGADGRVWIAEEFHTHLKWLAPASEAAPTSWGKVLIPQADGAGIFATGWPSVMRTRTSSLGEDVEVASDGSVWFTQGGGGHMADGPFFNSSRIIRYVPSSGRVDCYPVPMDNAETVGLLLDEANGRVWYTDASVAGAAIVSFRPAALTSDCDWDPYVDARPAVCAPGQSHDSGCHDRYVMPGNYPYPAHLVFGPDAAIWFTRYWDNSVGRLDLDTRELTTIPLPPPIVREGPGIWAGSGPWQLEFDAAGDLLITEFFDATVTRIRPTVMQEEDCTRLDSQGTNPCVTELFVGSDGFDLNTVHSLTVAGDGRAWFTYSGEIGILPPGGEALLLDLPVDAESLAGIAEDPTTGGMYFAMYFEHKIGLLRPATGDVDGVDYGDNCESDFNPAQENVDRDFVDLSPWNKPFNDHTWPISDSVGDACDDDADNDGLPNALEISGCLWATGPSDPLVRDTDGDLILDGPECVFGSDPLNASSRPMRVAPNDPDRDQLPTILELQLGTDPTRSDSDGDRVYDGVEFLSYGSNPTVRNSDGDACADGYESASVNPDTAVSSLDLLIVAVSFGPMGSAKYVPGFDINRDGAINATDLAFASTSFGMCKPN
jgi:streptogramin lyase